MVKEIVTENQLISRQPRSQSKTVKPFNATPNQLINNVNLPHECGR